MFGPLLVVCSAMSSFVVPAPSCSVLTTLVALLLLSSRRVRPARQVRRHRLHLSDPEVRCALLIASFIGHVFTSVSHAHVRRSAWRGFLMFASLCFFAAVVAAGFYRLAGLIIYSDFVTIRVWGKVPPTVSENFQE